MGGGNPTRQQISFLLFRSEEMSVDIDGDCGSIIDIADGRRKPYKATNQFPSFQKRGNDRRHRRGRNSMMENERKGAPGQGLQSANGLKTEREIEISLMLFLRGDH
ncbi:hypothetical protein CEXT_431201 [Caerostris extrusa]|uniref:Uncharacterized protein n=1 Tax=Caerostris extrusa TaxID=172846 RepID=A0AAV4N7W3_CAEEX|nr:hypothetical protein CEXT_431201 [Caerostris extrusa]